MFMETIPLTRRRRWFAGMFVLLSTGALAANDLPTAHGSPESTIKIITFNIMWEENGVRAGDYSLPVWEGRKDLVARLVVRMEADIVGFQEASPEQQAGLRRLLPSYTLVHHEATNNTNPILFKTGRFQLLDSGAFVLNAKPEVEGTNIGVRGSTWAHLTDRKSGHRLWVYSLHLDHRSKGPTRQISAVRLVERMTSHGGAVVVTGDFNASEVGPAMSFFYGRSALQDDAGKRVTNPRPLVTAYKSMHPQDSTRVIDHVLVGPGIHVRNAGRTASGNASDHDAFWAEVSLE
jgi:endonuclease/exonuclease/phosphatase family metal-dependent hydrolase